jgi:two-component system nitrate/nitrite response regulator NarL
MKDLTPREQEILKCISKGYDEEAISKEFWISAHTVKAYIKSLLRKFDVKNRTNLVNLVDLANLDNPPQD